jgi:hypothetical protein
VIFWIFSDFLKHVSYLVFIVLWIDTNRQAKRYHGATPICNHGAKISSSSSAS